MDNLVIFKLFFVIEVLINLMIIVLVYLILISNRLCYFVLFVVFLKVVFIFKLGKGKIF